ncbi:hypothetical protein FGU65_03275 [Methanoculleus sp. FWC-SCC1]|uniref:Transposase n=1 Tax=Methanoculleus frigidifontis TaxID=2584085 RepID=A0ABT8M7L2_9EURY|nr:hypothetical protein [Methanoculleus sp. FWC-SCC1]MDN7023923.1 hypothetical protein [Methanoculleus sp. FWC-SCC1]
MKKVLLPPMLIDLVGSALASMDGVTFTERDACPSCGGALTVHDLRKKRFAVLLEDGKRRVIHVFVKRFYCTRCGSLCYAEEPFYPDTRLGSPVVELSLLLAARMPYHRASRLLKAMGIVVDRGTIRNYAARDLPRVPYTELFGVPLPLSLLNLSLSAVGSKGRRVVGAEALAACGFPAADRAPLQERGLSKERDQRDKEKQKEEGKP